MLWTQASKMNEASQEMFDNAVEQLTLQHAATSGALERLGQTRTEIYDVQIRKFSVAFALLKNVELTPPSDHAPLGTGEISPADITGISFTAVDAVKATVATAGAGAATATAAYVSVGALGAASTGAAISGLSGAAAANATLAWFGGGALAAGGMGMAGGMVVLGGIALAPALLVAGFVFHQAGKKRLEKAKAARAEVSAKISEIETMSTVALGIEKRAKQLRRALRAVSKQFEAMVVWLETTTESETNYAAFDRDTRDKLYVATSTAITLRRALDVVLLEDDGSLTKESRIVLTEAKATAKRLGLEAAAA
jgi:hypothetical protein